MTDGLRLSGRNELSSVSMLLCTNRIFDKYGFLGACHPVPTAIRGELDEIEKGRKVVSCDFFNGRGCVGNANFTVIKDLTKAVPVGGQGVGSYACITKG